MKKAVLVILPGISLLLLSVLFILRVWKNQGKEGEHIKDHIETRAENIADRSRTGSDFTDGGPFLSKSGGPFS